MFRTSLCILVWVTLLLGCAGPEVLSRSDSTQDHYERIMRSQQKREAASLEAKQAREPVTAAELVARGDALRDSGQHEQAIMTYLRAVSRSSSDAVPRARIGYLHLQDDPRRAAIIFEQTTSKNPRLADGWTGLALARSILGDRDAALSAIERAAEIAPERLDVIAAEAIIRDLRGERDQAQALYLLALEKRPDDPVLLNNLGLSQLRAGQWKAAEQTLRRAEEVEPGNRVTLNNLGTALGYQRRYDDALEMFRRSGNEATALANLGWMHHLNEEYEEAIGIYVQALDAPGADKTALLQRIEAAQSAASSPASPEQ